jgi:hypothetical protein
MVLRHRRIGHEVLVGEHDAAVELLFAAIDPRQNERGGEKFESAAKRKEFVGAIPGAATACRIERRHAQATAVAPLEVCKQRYCVIGEGRKCQQRGSEKGAARNRSRHDLSIVLRGCLIRRGLWRGKGLSPSVSMR